MTNHGHERLLNDFCQKHGMQFTLRGIVCNPNNLITVINVMENIISLFKRHNGNDFETLLEPYIEHLYRLAYRFTSNKHDTEDLMQELLIKIYPRRSELLKVEQLKPWLTRILYNLFIDATRRAKQDPLREAPDLADFENTLDSGDSTEGEIESDQRRERLITAFKRLSPDHRAIITLHDIEGYTLYELEEMLDSPIGTLKSRLHRARQQLKDAILMEPFPAHLRVNG